MNIRKATSNKRKACPKCSGPDHIENSVQELVKIRKNNSKIIFEDSNNSQAHSNARVTPRKITNTPKWEASILR